MLEKLTILLFLFLSSLTSPIKFTLHQFLDQLNEAMKLNAYRKKIKTPNQPEAEICRKYWEIKEGGHYKYNLNDIKREYKLTTEELKSLVSANASMMVVCLTCGREINQHLTRDSLRLFFHWAGGPHYCTAHLPKGRTLNSSPSTIFRFDTYPDFEDGISITDKISKMELAAKNESFRKLNTYEFGILNVITKSADINELRSKLFSSTTKDDRRKIMDCIKFLDRINLVYIHENKVANKIEGIHITESLFFKLSRFR